MRTTQILSCLAIAVCWLGASGANAAFTTSCGGANDIDTSTVTALGCNVAEAGMITDLNIALEIDDLTANPYATDLEIVLTHVASATTVAIYLGPGIFGPTSRMDATFDDAAVAVAPGSGDILGLFLPAQSLSAFNGLELSGNWVLEILDVSGFPDEGLDLIDWSFTGTLTPEPSTSMLLIFGLLGLRMVSGRGGVAGSAN